MPRESMAEKEARSLRHRLDCAYRDIARLERALLIVEESPLIGLDRAEADRLYRDLARAAINGRDVSLRIVGGRWAIRGPSCDDTACDGTGRGMR